MYLYKAYLVRVVNGGLIKASIDLGFGVVSDLCPVTTGKIDQNNCIRNSYSKQKQTLTRSSNSIKIGTDTQNKVLRYQNARIIGLSKAITLVFE